MGKLSYTKIVVYFHTKVIKRATNHIVIAFTLYALLPYLLRFLLPTLSVLKLKHRYLSRSASRIVSSAMNNGLSTRFLTSQGWSGFGDSSEATAVRLAVAAVSLMGNSIIGKKKGRKPMLPPCCPLGFGPG